AVNQCFAPDTLVHTQRGLVPMRGLQTGDLVLGQGGEYREVTKKMVYEQHDAMVATDVKHSLTPLEVTAGHPLWALRSVPLEQSNERTYQALAAGRIAAAWVDAGELAPGDYMGMTIPTEVVAVDAFT